MSPNVSAARFGLSAVAHADLRRATWWLRWTSVCWIVLFWRLGWLSLLDPDEAHYAELTREMAQAGSWFVPLLDGTPFIDKPVLFHWLQAFAVKLFGETAFALRLPSACAAVSLFALTRWVGTSLFDEEVGEWGALMLATIPATFALGSVGIFDMVFCAFLFGGVGTLIVSAVRARPRLQHVGFVLIALAVVTKGPVAILLVGLFVGLVALCGDRGRRLLLGLQWKRGGAIVLLLAAPWFVWMYRQFGGQFIAEYVIAGNFWYFTQPLQFSPRAVSHTFYVRTFLGAFFPWSVITAGRAVNITRKWRDRQILPTAETLLWAWVVVVIGFFSIARFKLDTYIFPAAPACCLLAARGWQATRSAKCGASARMSILMMGILLLGLGVVSAIALFRIDLGLSAGASLVPIALTVGGAVTMREVLRNDSPPRLVIPLVTMLVVYGTTVLIGFPVLEKTRPVMLTAHFLRANSPASEAVGLYRLERWKASLRYYVGRRVEPLKDPEDVRRFLEASPQASVVMLRDDYEALRVSGLDIDPMSEWPAVRSTQGRGFRRQVWSQLLVVRGR